MHQSFISVYKIISGMSQTHLWRLSTFGGWLYEGKDKICEKSNHREYRASTQYGSTARVPQGGRRISDFLFNM